MPRVNLVPGEEKQRELRRRMYIVPLAGTIILAGILGGTYYYYSNRLDNADRQLQDIKQSNNALQKQVAEMKRYDEIKNKKQSQLNIVTTLYGQRVHWSRTIDDLAFVIPEDVWLVAIKATVPGIDTGSAAAATSKSGSGQSDIEIEGYTREMPSVATLLVRLGLIPSIANVTLTSAEKEELQGQTVTHFKISASLKQTGETQGAAVVPDTSGGASPVTPTTGTSTTPTTGSTTPTGTTSRTTGTTR